MKQILIFIFLVFFALPQAKAGWEISIRYDHYGEKQTLTYIVDKNRLKISTEEFDFIYNGQDKEVVVINRMIKSYYHGSFEDYQDQLKHLLSIDPKKADRILPETYFHRFDKMLAEIFSDDQQLSNLKTPTIKVVNSGNKQQIAGYQAQEYKVYLDSLLMENLWLSKDVRVNDDIDLIKAINFFRGVEGTGLKQGKNYDTQAYEQLELQGFLMKLNAFNTYGLEVYSQECISIRELKIYFEDSFRIPKDFQKRTLIDVILANS